MPKGRFQNIFNESKLKKTTQIIRSIFPKETWEVVNAIKIASVGKGIIAKGLKAHLPPLKTLPNASHLPRFVAPVVKSASQRPGYVEAALWGLSAYDREGTLWKGSHPDLGKKGHVLRKGVNILEKVKQIWKRVPTWFGKGWLDVNITLKWYQTGFQERLVVSKCDSSLNLFPRPVRRFSRKQPQEDGMSGL